MPRRKLTKVKVPKAVQRNAQKGLDLRREYGRGGTDVGRAMARLIATSDYLPHTKVKKISQYFPRHAGDRLDLDGKKGKKISNGYIAWLLWGGDAGWDWSAQIANKIEDE